MPTWLSIKWLRLKLVHNLTRLSSELHCRLTIFFKFSYHSDHIWIKRRWHNFLLHYFYWCAFMMQPNSVCGGSKWLWLLNSVILLWLFPISYRDFEVFNCDFLAALPISKEPSACWSYDKQTRQWRWVWQMDWRQQLPYQLHAVVTSLPSPRLSITSHTQFNTLTDCHRFNDHSLS